MGSPAPAPDPRFRAASGDVRLDRFGSRFFLGVARWPPGGVSMRRIRFLLGAALGLGSWAAASEPARRYQVVTPKADGIIATGINRHGGIVGFEWIEDKARP